MAQAGNLPKEIGTYEEMIAETIMSRHESNSMLGEQGHWLFDVDDVTAAADAAADFGFDASEIVEFHADEGWHHRHKVISDIGQAMADGHEELWSEKKIRKTLKQKNKEKYEEPMWDIVMDILRAHVKEDLLIYIVCPNEVEVTFNGNTRQGLTLTVMLGNPKWKHDTAML